MSELMVNNNLFRKRDVRKYTWVRMMEGRMSDRALMDLDYVINIVIIQLI